ncbi:MAG TPA: hypothetical protein ENK32_11335, partial [Anaerolineae bacterium]|nr:hypothetical protein [Anaerolineae bacterium]
MVQGNPHQNNHTAVFLAAGFEEEPVVSLLCQLRDAGLPVSLIGLSSQPLTGNYGVTLCPDEILTDLPKDATFHLIVIPGNGRSVQSLLVSPHFHRLLKNTLAEDGCVAALDTAVPALEAAGIPRYAANPNHYIRQNHTPLNDFITRLTHLTQDPNP